MKTTTLDVRGLDYHIQEWGDPSNPTLVLLHGWMDCGGSYKFMAAHLADQFHLVAPDLRGFGKTQHVHGYWFPDYFADLEEILDYYVPEQAANIVGHSMGGNIALMYAGIRPNRVARVLSLDALGMAPTESSDAPIKYRRWMQEILSGEPSKIYPNEMALRGSIRKGNPRLSDEMIGELADLWGTPFGDEGAMRLKHDHAHRYTNPVRYSFDDVLALWGEVNATVGLVLAEESFLYRKLLEMGRIDLARDILKVSDEDYFLLSDTGHMVHLEQPHETAKIVRNFFAR